MMKMRVEVLKAETDQLKEKAFAIRQDVFVIEQQVSREDEFDEFENISHHFVVLEGEVPVGAARWREKPDGIKLERFAVKKNHRGQGIGSALLKAVLENIRTVKGTGQYLYLHAQLPAIPLYEKHGFSTTGPQFEECNIQHFKMELVS